MALLTDDCDLNQNRLITSFGGNGDLYIGVISDEYGLQSVRISTSGGNAPSDVKLAVAELFRAMEKHKLNDID